MKKTFKSIRVNNIVINLIMESFDFFKRYEALYNDARVQLRHGCNDKLSSIRKEIQYVENRIDILADRIDKGVKILEEYGFDSKRFYETMEEALLRNDALYSFFHE